MRGHFKGRRDGGVHSIAVSTANHREARIGLQAASRSKVAAAAVRGLVPQRGDAVCETAVLPHSSTDRVG